MNRKDLTVNIQYSLAQAGCWISLCISVTCAAVFLQDRGYSNSRLGLVISLGSAGAFVLSPMLGGLIDRSERLSTVGALWLLLSLQGMLVASFFALPGRSLPLSVCYALFVAIVYCVVPLMTQLCLDCRRSGYNVNFGFARGMGSLAFAAAAAWFGGLIERCSPSVLIVCGLGVTAFELAVLIPFTLRRSGKSTGQADKAEKSSSMLRFLSENRRFCGLMAGVALLFFTHALVNNFLINIIHNVGGGAKQLGNINAYMAVIELPAMLFYGRLSRRVGCTRCVRASACFFAVKALLVAFSGSMTGLYAAHSFQAVAYALLTPALVEYVDRHIAVKDSARAQSLSYAMTTLGSIFASLLGGIMFDSLSIRATLMIGAAVSASGAVICLAFSEK